MHEANGDVLKLEHVGRDEFKESVKNVLAWRVGGLCSNPDCMQPTKGPHTDDAKVTNLGTASHIHAAAKNGPRYDESQTREERGAPTNGIWLCLKHGVEVDTDENRFPATLLKQWKAKAEQAAALRQQSAPVASAAHNLLRAASELLDSCQSLPDGTWLERPELQRVRELLDDEEARTIALLGVPGSGKSAFLARLGCSLAKEGWNVVAIKADRLPSTVHGLPDLAHHLEVDVPVARAMYALSCNAKTILIVDQLDALSDLTDVKTERLAVLLSLVSRVSASGIPVVCSVREFDFQHDQRFRSLGADEIRLGAIPSDDIDEVLKRIGFDPGRASPKLKSLLAIPYWLNLFVKLTWDIQQALPVTSQALLEEVWRQKLLSPAATAAENDAAVSALAEMISDREELWIPRGSLRHMEVVLQRLLAAGIFALDATGSRISFAHQTLYEFARARAFVRAEALTTHVLARQGSLFVRPTIWMALHYLRSADPRRYQTELTQLWHQATRPHIRSLLIEFIGQSDPEPFERLLLMPVFEDPKWARAAFNATMQSPSWLRILRSGTLQRVMSSRLSNVTYGALVASLKLDRDETLILIRRVWGSTAEQAQLTVGVLRQLEDWTVVARDLLADALLRIGDADDLIDSFAWKLKAKNPGYAIDIVAGHLQRKLQAQIPFLPVSSPLAPNASLDEQLSWARDREPFHTLKAMFDSTSHIHVLIELAEAEPGLFLGAFFPWVAALLGRAVEPESWNASYRIDYVCDCSRADHTDRELPHALRVASEKLADADADAFLALCSEWSKSELHSVHAILSYGLERAAAAHVQQVVEYLLSDARRLCLGELDAHAARSIALLESIRAGICVADVRRLELAIEASVWISESDEREPQARIYARRRNRDHRLRLLQALPAELLGAETAARMEQELRVYGAEGRAPSRSTGLRPIGSPMSSNQMELAADEHILGLFEDLPDSTGFHHPTRMMQGGAVEAGREFAVLAKQHPERALALIARLAPGRNETPVATALGSLSESSLSTAQLQQLIAECHERGFASEQFRTEASRCLGRRAGDEQGLPEAAIVLLREWLSQVPTRPRSTPPPTSLESTGGPPFLFNSGGFTSIPGGSYAFLDTLLIAYLSSSLPREREWIEMLSEHLARDEDPLVWRAFAHRLVHLRVCEHNAAGRFVAALFERYPEALLCGAGVKLAANASWWVEPDTTAVWARQLASSTWQHGSSAAGELIAFLAIRTPPLAWAQRELQEVATGLVSNEHAFGAAHALMGVWRDPSVRDRAGTPLAALLLLGLPAVDAVIFKRLAHDELSGDEPSLRLLSSITERTPTFPHDHIADIVVWLSLFVQTRPAVVHQLLEKLLSEANAEGEGSSRLFAAAQHLVNITLTLQRMPEFREAGLRMFEQILDLGLYGAREALDEIDFARR